MRKTKTQRLGQGNRGFGSLFGIIITLAVMAILAGIIMPSVGQIRLSQRVTAERESCAKIAEAIHRSFYAGSGVNISEWNTGTASGSWSNTASSFDPDRMLAGGAIAEGTIFEPRPEPGEPAPTMTLGGNTASLATIPWQTKLLRSMGVLSGTDSVTVDNTSRSEASGIVYNTYGRRRFLLLGPTNEAVQRYVLVSCMWDSDPSGRPIIPLPNDFPNPSFTQWKDWFDVFWNWPDASNATVAASAGTGVYAVPASAWTPPGGSGWYSQMNSTTFGHTYVGRMVVTRITQKKLRIHAVNSSSSPVTITVGASGLGGYAVPGGTIPEAGAVQMMLLPALGGGISEVQYPYAPVGLVTLGDGAGTSPTPPNPNITTHTVTSLATRTAPSDGILEGRTVRIFHFSSNATATSVASGFGIFPAPWMAAANPALIKWRTYKISQNMNHAFGDQ